MNLKNYQQNAVDELLHSTTFDIKKTGLSRTLLYAPTGSGKTIIMSEFISKFVSIVSEDCCFIWFSPSKANLHIQSYIKLKNYFDGYPLCKVLDYEKLHDFGEIFSKDSVTFLGWDSLNSKTNKLTKDSEKFNFQNLISNTKQIRRKIILIIDESHTNASSENSTEIIEYISPNLIIDLTATPNNSIDYKNKISINIDDVIDEQMIIKEIEVNKTKDTHETIIENAIVLQNTLRDLNENNQTGINPLCLIQIDKSVISKLQIKSLIEIFNKRDISETSVAFWLSEKKELLNGEPFSNEELLSNNSNISFLIFKQALVEGWDCPRAKILLKYRNESKSNSFDIQTLGRIFRMPEQKHYDEEMLNHGYVYTEHDNIKLLGFSKEQSIYVKQVVVEPKEKDNFGLLSYYKNRSFYNDINTENSKVIKDLYDKFLNEYSIKEKSLSDKELLLSVAGNYNEEIKSIIHDNSKSGENKVYFEQYQTDIELKANKIISNMLNEIGFNVSRSVKKLESIIVICLTNKEIQDENIYSTFISDPILQEEIYKILKKIKNREEHRVSYDSSGEKYLWNADKLKVSNEVKGLVEHIHFKKNIYPLVELRNSRSQIEKDFETFIDSHSKVEYWYKNGVNKKEYFGIQYFKNGKESTFYPDFIIKFNTGDIMICDTKSGYTKEIPDIEDKYAGLTMFARESDVPVKIGLVSRVTPNGEFRVFNKAQNYKISNDSDVSTWIMFSEFIDLNI